MNTDDTPAARIARLDDALARRGQAATVKRRVGTSLTDFVSLSVRVRLSGYGTADLSSGIKVTDSKFVMSPSAIATAGAAWPGAAGGGSDIKIGDFMLVEGRQRAIAQVDNVRIGDVLVRIEGRISG